jgi:hypothetical protein
MRRSFRHLARHVRPGDRVLYLGSNPERFFAAASHCRPGSGYVAVFDAGLRAAQHLGPDIVSIVSDRQYDTIVLDNIAQFLFGDEVEPYRAAISRLLTANGRIIARLWLSMTTSSISGVPDYPLYDCGLDVRAITDPLWSVTRLCPDNFVPTIETSTGLLGAGIVVADPRRSDSDGRRNAGPTSSFRARLAG